MIEEFEDRHPFYALKKVQVGPKVISLFSSDGTKFSFEKGCYGTGNDISLCVHRTRNIIHPEKCNLGHTHEAKTKREHEFAWLHLTWEEAETLFEWFNSGTWREIRSRRKNGVANLR